MLDNRIKTSIMFCMRLFTKQEITDGEYRGYRYLIADNGSHFCAYFYVPKGHKMYKYDFYNDEHDLPVHGGVTYYDRKPKYAVIGWDYLHYFDNPTTITLENVLNDVHDVIDSFITLYDLPTKNRLQIGLDKVLKSFRK